MFRLSFRIEEIENRWIGKILISALSRLKRQRVFFFLFTNSCFTFTTRSALWTIGEWNSVRIYLESRNWIKLANKDSNSKLEYLILFLFQLSTVVNQIMRGKENFYNHPDQRNTKKYYQSKQALKIHPSLFIVELTQEKLTEVHVNVMLTLTRVLRYVINEVHGSKFERL